MSDPASEPDATPAPAAKREGDETADEGASRDSGDVERKRNLERASAAAIAPTERELKRRLTAMMISMFALMLCIVLAGVIVALDLIDTARFDAAPVDLDLRSATPDTMPPDDTRVRLVHADLNLGETLSVSQPHAANAQAYLSPAVAYPADEEELPESGTTEAALRLMRSFQFSAAEVRVMVVFDDAPGTLDDDMRLMRPSDAQVTGFLRPALATFDKPLADQLASHGYEVWNLWLIDTVSEPPPMWRWVGAAVGGLCAIVLMIVVQVRWRRFRKAIART